MPRNAEVLLTGATGFLGKVVLETLLRRRAELGVGRVHLLVRPRGGATPESRLRSRVLTSACFSKLPANWAKHIRVVAGDVCEDGLAVARTTRVRLTSRVSHVIHCAASVDFDLGLDAATNVAGGLNTLEFARSCPRIRSLVAVSTAFVHTGRGPLEERLVRLPTAASDIYASIVSGRTPRHAVLRDTGQANTYTLTKCLAEHLLHERSGGIPVTIVRPSVISASWRHPFPSWIDSNAAFAGFVTAIGSGQLTCVVADPDRPPGSRPVR